MPDNVPARIPTSFTLDGGPSSRQLLRAARAMEKADEMVFSHFLMVEVARQCEEIDNTVLAEVVKDSLQRELALYDWAMARVDGSAAKAQIVAEKLALLSTTNSTRIARRFGG